MYPHHLGWAASQGTTGEGASCLQHWRPQLLPSPLTSPSLLPSLVFCKDASIRLRSSLNTGQLHLRILNQVIVQRPYFHIRSCSEVPGGHGFQGRSSTRCRTQAILSPKQRPWRCCSLTHTVPSTQAKTSCPLETLSPEQC